MSADNYGVVDHNGESFGVAMGFESNCIPNDRLTWEWGLSLTDVEKWCVSSYFEYGVDWTSRAYEAYRNNLNEYRGA